MIRSQPVATVSCPSCDTEFPVDPAKVPDEGIHAICSSCRRVFHVEVDGLEVAAPDRPPESSEADTTSAISEEAVDPGADVDGEVGTDLDLAEEEALGDDRDIPAEPEKPDSEEVEDPVADAEPEPEAEPASPPGDAFEDLRSIATEATLVPDDDADGGFEVEESTLVRGRERFGRRDPHERARHLARVLVSDIVAYHPNRYHESLARGTLEEDFEDEVEKSRKEYRDQVGEELAETTSYFNEALNEILARGESIF